ncbi:phosphatidate cytidylyltransferase [Euzebya tangerina]|uniref:phosphatidate cytidylyltransferase n=1 Tax=Euzebya tangerina TaxID=591198 RepID=UPI000E321179|nr:phosphatidate cytidylyltransferase [Euzebya tangerina]
MAAPEQPESSADGQPVEPIHRGGRNLPVAIGVGVGLATMFVGSLLIHPLLFLTFVLVNIGIALSELHAAFARTKAPPPTLVALIALPVMLYGAYLGGSDFVVVGLFMGLLTGFLAVMVTGKRGHAVSRIAALSLMLLWVNLGASSLGLLLQRDDGHWYVMAATALTVTHDIGAYAFGRNFGRHRMAPQISPKKSWEGFGGAVVTTVLLAVLVTARLVPDLSIGVALAVAGAVVIASTTGDLAESVLKRDLGVKDLGTIFPGHGGVMDRIDALLISLPATHVTLLTFGI